MTARERSEDGFASVWAVGAVAALTMVYAVLVWLGSAALTRHRATGAADLAALAAASHARTGSQAACAKAALVGERMHVRIRSCRLSGWDALVEVVARPPGLLGNLGAASARARAGPVTEHYPGPDGGNRLDPVNGRPTAGRPLADWREPPLAGGHRSSRDQAPARHDERSLGVLTRSSGNGRSAG